MAGSLIGSGSASRLTAHPTGATASPLGYYEYLPPGYGEGTKKPLLVFLHGYGGNGDGTPAQLANVINDAGIPYYIANNGWAADRPFVVLAPQHNNIDSPAYPYPCDVAFGGSCLMQHQHDYGNPLPAGSPCWAPSEVQAFLAYALANYDVDPTRVYLTGLSCGGYGVGVPRTVRRRPDRGRRPHCRRRASGAAVIRVRAGIRPDLGLPRRRRRRRQSRRQHRHDRCAANLPHAACPGSAPHHLPAGRPQLVGPRIQRQPRTGHLRLDARLHDRLTTPALLLNPHLLPAR
jgi:hypothetical protein